jgi:phage tail sheath protein FI
MAVTLQRTPGVYVTEEDAFPPSIVGVQTAIPAFIGYTDKANVGGKPIYMEPQKIGSFAEFVSIFGYGFKPTFDTDPGSATDYDVSFPTGPAATDYYTVKQSSDSKFYMYPSIKWYFDNGGQECYIVSVGNYTDNGTTATGVDITAAKIVDGLSAIGDVVGPTLLAVPDATLATEADYTTIIQAMLAQCNSLQDRFAILDVFGTLDLDQSSATFASTDLPATITAFRTATGTENLDYGAAYFPFLKTSSFPTSDVNFTYFENAKLVTMLKAQSAALYVDPQKTDVDAMIDETTVVVALPEGADKDQKTADLEGNLQNSVPVLKEVEAQVALDMGVLPPSGGMAGIIVRVDESRGVWNAPANTSMSAVIAPTLSINSKMQEDLNAPLDGKAVDVIRAFPGRGTIVWGARTLLGNSPDWRYIQVRRTVIYIEQSIKAAMQPFVFAANDGKTWSTVVSAVSGFLQQTWSQGGLFGSTPQQAFSVECGLGSTMTAQDILDGYMIVQVRLQLIRPAEFIILNFKQSMQEA